MQTITTFDNTAEGWERSLYAFLAEKERRSGSRRTAEDFAAELARSQSARARFDGFAPSHRREYLEWVNEAKRPETRAKRIAQASEWISEGKKRNWKYEDC